MNARISLWAALVLLLGIAIGCHEARSVNTNTLRLVDSDPDSGVVIEVHGKDTVLQVLRDGVAVTQYTLTGLGPLLSHNTKAGCLVQGVDANGPVVQWKRDGQVVREERALPD